MGSFLKTFPERVKFHQPPADNSNMKTLYFAVRGDKLTVDCNDVTIELTGPELNLVTAFAGLEILVPPGTTVTRLESSSVHFPEDEDPSWDVETLSEFLDTLFANPS